MINDQFDQQNEPKMQTKNMQTENYHRLSVHRIRNLLQRLCHLDHKLLIVLDILAARSAQRPRLCLDPGHHLSELELGVRRHLLLVRVEYARAVQHIEAFAELEPLGGRYGGDGHFEVALQRMDQFEDVVAPTIGGGATHVRRIAGDELRLLDGWCGIDGGEFGRLGRYGWFFADDLLVVVDVVVVFGDLFVVEDVFDAWNLREL
jgi:hypothetical protein